LQLISSTGRARQKPSENSIQKVEEARWRNWIAHLTTDQEVAGSSPARVVINPPHPLLGKVEQNIFSTLHYFVYKRFGLDFAQLFPKVDLCPDSLAVEHQSCKLEVPSSILG